MAELMQNIDSYIYLIPLLPLLGFVINGIAGKKLERWMVHLLGVGSVFVAFMISLLALWKIINTGQPISLLLGSWISSGSFNVNIGLKIDQLSAVMINIVTGVGFLIHFYSMGYMKDDPGIARFFAYMNLFMFAMLILVMGDNLLLMFLGWEGVGLCSYLLIGFWYKNNDFASAGKKAFIVNRIGDFAFLLGIFLIFIHLDTLNFSEMRSGVSGISVTRINIITLLLFIGAIGKSAQIPLYVWLPDAMAGPTPVSALIHAATMVTAGVYMIGRLYFLFLPADITRPIILIVGALTALYSGTIAITQNDIKKVLAYSTVSQLGYMFMAMAVGAFSVGIFHLMTHAFFKALLFLSAGSVIFACHHEQDMSKMGGLAQRLPITYRAMLIGILALSGIVPFISGFLSKDLILEKVYEFMPDMSSISVGVPFWYIGVLAAVCTAIYSFRLMGMTFWSKPRMTQEQYNHVKEPPKSMTGVLIILAFLSIFGGLIGVPKLLGGANYFHHFLANYFVSDQYSSSDHGATPYILMAVSTSLGIILALVIGRIYGKDSKFPDKLSKAFLIRRIYKLFYNKYYIDELYEFLIVKPIMKGSYFLWKYFDMLIIDGLVNGTAYVVRALGDIGRKTQTGQVNTYALSIIVGIIAILIYFFSF